jgi:thymidylate synthase
MYKQGNRQFMRWEFEVVEPGDTLIRRALIEKGDLGSVYGKQWRNFGGVDQIAKLLTDLKEDPYSRRLLVSAWNPCDLQDMALPPCHTLWQLKAYEDGGLSLRLTQRSCDAFLGGCFNIASYALLLEMLCFVSGRKARELSISFGDLHIYDNHREQVATQLTRISYPLPTVTIEAERKDSWLETLLSLEYSNIKLDNYKHHPALPAPVAV